MDNLATTKNITMKQFNGTDYDTLYPKTDVKQIENLTPSSIGAVSKSGDTMTGDLYIKKGSAGIRLNDTASSGGGQGSVVSEANTLWLSNKNIPDNSTNYRAILLHNSARTSSVNDSLQLYDKINNVPTYYNILHTGNAQSLGFPKIATGSYVGTGYSGQSHPMSINVGFAPKFFWICLKLHDKDGVPVAYTIPGGGVQEDNGLFINPFTKYYCSSGSTNHYYVTVTWGSTMSWYGYVDFDDTKHGQYQFNEAGVTYYWVAIG